MTLNGEMALILHYFTDFVYDVVVKQSLGLPRFQNLLLIVYDHINTKFPTPLGDLTSLLQLYVVKQIFKISASEYLK